MTAGELPMPDRLAGLAARAGSQENYTLSDLIDIMAILRTPNMGCPWDLEQTFETIAPYTIEEAYEVADAIARGDPDDLKEELGDLLLQVVFHARMAEECGAFDFGDTADALARKLIRRHPHVFGSDMAKGAANVPGIWERIKAEEAAAKAKAKGEAAPPESILDGVPLALPALTRSVKLQRRAAKVGFDWSGVDQVLAKVAEELAEFEQEVKAGRQDAMEEEFGDVLFVLANLARRLEIDPEQAMRSANAKFTRRFHHVERRLAERGDAPEDAALADMEALWNEAKALEKHRG